MLTQDKVKVNDIPTQPTDEGQMEGESMMESMKDQMSSSMNRVAHSVGTPRMLVPIALGLMAFVGYQMWRQYSRPTW